MYDRESLNLSSRGCVSSCVEDELCVLSGWKHRTDLYRPIADRASAISLDGCSRQLLVSQRVVTLFRCSWISDRCVNFPPHRTTTADTAVWLTNGARFWKLDSSARCPEPTASRRTLMNWVSARFIISLFKILPPRRSPLEHLRCFLSSRDIIHPIPSAGRSMCGIWELNPKQDI